MASARSFAAIALLLLLVGSAGALAWWSARVESADADVAVIIVGPEGELFHGQVRVANATALRALSRAAEEANLTVAVDDYGPMGTYVRAIGGHEAKGASGWVYDVLRAGVWHDGDRSAARYALHEGDTLRWRWTDA